MLRAQYVRWIESLTTSVREKTDITKSDLGVSSFVERDALTGCADWLSRAVDGVADRDLRLAGGGGLLAGIVRGNTSAVLARLRQNAAEAARAPGRSLGAPPPATQLETPRPAPAQVDGPDRLALPSPAQPPAPAGDRSPGRPTTAHPHDMTGPGEL